MQRSPYTSEGRPAAFAWWSAAVVAVDQATKSAASILGSDSVHLVRPVRNDALSLQVADSGRWTEVLLMAAGVLAATVLGHRWVSTHRIPAWAAALVVGGAASNLADRAALGAVRDFLVAGPVVLNLADLAVLTGLIAVLQHRRSAPTHPEGRRCSEWTAS